MQVVERDQQRGCRHLLKPVQHREDPPGGRRGDVWVEHVRADQRADRLRGKAKRQRRLHHIATARADVKARPGDVDGVPQDARLAQSGLAENEQRLTSAGRGGVQRGTDGGNRRISLDQCRVHRRQAPMSHRKPGRPPAPGARPPPECADDLVVAPDDVAAVDGKH